jgi:hypothetical protein
LCSRHCAGDPSDPVTLEFFIHLISLLFISIDCILY